MLRRKYEKHSELESTIEEVNAQNNDDNNVNEDNCKINVYFMGRDFILLNAYISRVNMVLEVI